ncbi:MAG TPA: PKD domain-containing protein [Nitrososphaera sp.]|nr:PKD domain-containing protein [Nitrososphaera sp.]
MVAMSSTVKSAIFFSAIGIAAGIGIMLLIVDDQTLLGLFNPLIGESVDNEQGGNLPFAIRQNYNATLPVGEEGVFLGLANGGKEPYTFEWKFSDGLTFTGQNVTRRFDAPGIYQFEVTVTDADGKQVKSTTNPSINVLQ